MRRLVSLLLVLSLLLTGCSGVLPQSTPEAPSAQPAATEPAQPAASESPETVPTEPLQTAPGEPAPTELPQGPEETDIPVQTTDAPVQGTDGEEEPSIPELTDLSDPDLPRYAEDLFYREMVDSLDDGYFVEDVDAVYISQEYLEELEFNSQANIFFGYTLSELDAQFQGNRYFFTVDENGTTNVQPFEEMGEVEYVQAIKNVATGGGAVLFIATVIYITKNPESVNVLVAEGGKAVSELAVQIPAVSNLTAKIVELVGTEKLAEISAKLSGFAAGAIRDAVWDAAADKASNLAGGVLSGLGLEDAEKIQKESKYPLEIIKAFTSMAQYDICKGADLKAMVVNGVSSLVRDIALDYVDELGRTNLERMQQGLAAIDPSTGLSYELHHIGQELNSPLAILTKAEHMQGGNNTVWHDTDKESTVHNEENEATWTKERRDFWKDLASILTGGDKE